MTTSSTGFAAASPATPAMPPEPPIATSPATSSATSPAPAATPPALPRGFAYLSGANLAAQSAKQVSLAAVPIVAVLALNTGPGEIGLLNTAQSLPFLLLAIPLGLRVDRHARRQLMVAAEALRALSLAVLLAATAGGQLSLLLLALLGFIGVSGTVGFSVAAPAPALVLCEALGAANSRLELARSAAFAGGPQARRWPFRCHGA